jgi:hypothetical protein
MLVVSPIPAGPGVLPVGYCTSEQMDLLRQVFAEVDHVAGRPARHLPSGSAATR